MIASPPVPYMSWFEEDVISFKFKVKYFIREMIDWNLLMYQFKPIHVHKEFIRIFEINKPPEQLYT
ncbi:MAG: hypothetical protein AM326_00015 [Candidatus Thorarchaeota archaeon SMTZ-45]|nr:MAG: hypothetical protein AM326_00015 [Candidatus Thorarchaeota archaeon SMTZ-45]